MGTFSIHFTAYIDAIRNGGYFAETQLPPSLYHLNLFQNGSLPEDGNLHGDRVSGAENFNVEDDWGLSVTHYTIDDTGAVRDTVKDRLRSNVSK